MPPQGSPTLLRWSRSFPAAGSTQRVKASACLAQPSIGPQLSSRGDRLRISCRRAIRQPLSLWNRGPPTAETHGPLGELATNIGPSTEPSLTAFEARKRDELALRSPKGPSSMGPQPTGRGNPDSKPFAVWRAIIPRWNRSFSARKVHCPPDLVSVPDSAMVPRPFDRGGPAPTRELAADYVPLWNRGLKLAEILE